MMNLVYRSRFHQLRGVGNVCAQSRSVARAMQHRAYRFTRNTLYCEAIEDITYSQHHGKIEAPAIGSSLRDPIGKAFVAENQVAERLKILKEGRSD